ncbi:MAG: serine/threonine-protein kinase [Pirellulales bacterium]
MTERDIFENALAFAEPAERAQYLEKACGGDAALCEHIEGLLALHGNEGSFLESPMIAPIGPTVDFAGEELVGRQIGPYKLREQIGEGGMGIVYLAEQVAPVRRKVALKIIKPGMASRAVLARFDAERQALAMMDQENIARMFDAGLSDAGYPYFVMELVQGLPITEYCDQHRLGTRQRLELFHTVCRAIQFAHQKGVIHRDLKPSNILIADIDGTAVPKVIDFGIAKAVGPKLTEQTVYTHFDQVVGTPLYMSPEQAGLGGIDVDTRSDVYSMGVLLFELLTGHTPFDNATLKRVGFDEMRRIIREDDAPTPSTLLNTLKAEVRTTVCQGRSTDLRQLTDSLRGELDWIVVKALEKNRERRYESATALAADVQRYLDNEPIVARPPTFSYRLSKFLLRNRSRVTAGLAGVIALLIIAGVIMQGRWTRTQHALLAARAIQSSLASAKTAVETSNIGIAEQNLVEARTRLDHLGGTQRGELEKEIVIVQADIERWKADQAKFQTLFELDRQSTDLMFRGEGRIVAREMLDLYGVLRHKDWNEAFETSLLSAEQKSQVREKVYETLLLLADDSVRLGPRSEDAAREGLTYLDQAMAFHEPTKALYWVRKEIHTYLNDELAWENDQTLYDSTPATIAWDWFLPGHTAGWEEMSGARFDRTKRPLNCSQAISILFLSGIWKHGGGSVDIKEASLVYRMRSTSP